MTIRIAPGPFAKRDQLIEKLKTLLDSYQSVDGDSLMYTTNLDVAEWPPKFCRPLFARTRQWVVRRVMSWMFSTKTDPTAHAMIIALPKSDVLGELWPDTEIEGNGRNLKKRLRRPMRQEAIRAPKIPNSSRSFVHWGTSNSIWTSLASGRSRRDS